MYIIFALFCWEAQEAREGGGLDGEYEGTLSGPTKVKGIGKSVKFSSISSRYKLYLGLYAHFLFVHLSLSFPQF